MDRWIDWLIDLLNNKMIDWLVDWLIDWLVCWLVDRSIDLSIEWLIDKPMSQWCSSSPIFHEFAELPIILEKYSPTSDEQCLVPASVLQASQRLIALKSNRPYVTAYKFSYMCGHFILSTHLRLTKMSSKFRKICRQKWSFNTCSNIKKSLIIR